MQTVLPFITLNAVFLTIDFRGESLVIVELVGIDDRLVIALLQDMLQVRPGHPAPPSLALCRSLFSGDKAVHGPVVGRADGVHGFK